MFIIIKLKTYCSSNTFLLEISFFDFVIEMFLIEMIFFIEIFFFNRNSVFKSQCGLSPTLKSVFQQVSCVNTKF